MSRLHQIQLQFDPHQDRAVLRIRTTDQSEFLFWLTRRFVKLMWQVLIKIVEKDTQVSAQANPDNKQAVLAFQHEKAVQAGNRRQSDVRPRLRDGNALLQCCILFHRRSVDAGLLYFQCGTSANLDECTRVALVNEKCECVYETLVKPHNRITRYKTQ